MDDFLSVIGDLNIQSDMGSDSSLTLRNMLKGLRVNSAFKSVTHNQDGQLDYVFMKDDINAAKYVAGNYCLLEYPQMMMMWSQHQVGS